YSRYKRLRGFNVLHPMGYDAFGLPAEQYAAQTGQHPRITTEANIARYREQLDKIGFSFDWDREVRTCDPAYYRWTQKTFIDLYSHYYDTAAQQAKPAAALVAEFEKNGNLNVSAACGNPDMKFTAAEWKSMDAHARHQALMEYRLAYQKDGMVNWCAALGTVLANDEVANGLSVRGGHPVERKLMRQWYLRITAYADRLLDGLNRIDWSDSLKETQRSWIGRSTGANVRFKVLLRPHPQPLSKGEGSNTVLRPHPQPLSKGEGSNTATQGEPSYFTTSKPNWITSLNKTKEGRKNRTEAEAVLWENLRNRKLGLKFRRQHPVGEFIPDFVCINQKLVVEVDGEYHNEKEQQAYDAQRTEYLNSLGYSVIRFTNDEVLYSTKKVVEKIKNTLSALPLSFGEGPGVRSTIPESEANSSDSGTFLEIFTTRPDTIFGATFMVVCPEHHIFSQFTPEPEVAAYVSWAKNRSERERQSEVRNVTGKFTGLYAENPFTGRQIPIWVSEYVLAGYGTGAIMAVPAHDSRDYAFAKHFGLEITPIIEGCDVSTESFDAKEGVMVNSGFLNGMQVKDAIAAAVKKVEALGIGSARVNYRLRDATFSRQRYWGEPFPIYYRDNIPHTLPPDALPLELPPVDKYLPTEAGDPPLGRATAWRYEGKHSYELSTMPGFAGSSAYFIRYMDPHNPKRLVDKAKNEYWRNVDLYIGGTEHATGHLMYSRFWNKFLFDIGEVCEDEPFQKLINQGMIQGRSSFVYRVAGANTFVSLGLKDKYEVQEIHVDISLVQNDVLDVERFRRWNPDYANAEFILENGKYICGWAVEKMSKSMYNVVNPDDVVSRYGADTLRLYEMFLGPLEMSKPWDTNGIDGVHRFLRKLWRLFYGKSGTFAVSDEQATPQELKVLHKIIKKVQDGIEGFSFNTAVSGFMICVNELTELGCSKREVLEPLTVLLSPFAPHAAEELWEALGHADTICDATFPDFNPDMLAENSFEYPISFNGKLRYKKELPLGLNKEEARQLVASDPNTEKFLGGKPMKNFVYVPGKIVNIVC
ncbi:MAG: class I tRNA ligase family protein, partial [Prevotellaceae bacterium]|nr:class I tRNA ligase family protein [Prevotellaceae bacterium]